MGGAHKDEGWAKKPGIGSPSPSGEELGRGFGAGAARRLAAGFLLSLRPNPHPALRATFSQREKGKSDSGADFAPCPTMIDRMHFLPTEQ
jgi:hypothetical protein